MKINYVIATWAGKRDRLHKNSTEYLKIHLSALLKFENSISQITIVKPDFDITHEYYANSKKYMDKISNLKILDYNNDCLSYGQWIAAYKKYSNNFDYYIFVEDDYCPAIDNFDSLLVKLLDNRDVYLCGQAGDVNIWGKHAAISNGIVSSKSLEKSINNLYKFTKASGVEQVGFSNGFLESGIDIVDWTDYYMSPFYDSDPHVLIEYSKVKNDKYIFIPIQMKLENIPIKNYWTNIMVMPEDYKQADDNNFLPDEISDNKRT